MKIIPMLKRKGYTILINNIIDDEKHLDSFWYDDLVLAFKLKHSPRIFNVHAIGDIRIYNKKRELVYDNKPRNSGLGFKLKEDKDLSNINKKGFVWENNNWFQLTEEGNDDGVVLNSLDELKELILTETEILIEEI